LEAERNSAKDDAEKLNVTLALLDGYFYLEEHEKVIAICTELANQYPESRRVFMLKSAQLRILGRPDESDRLAEERLHRNPEDLDALRILVWGAQDREDYSKAHELAQNIIDAGKAEPDDLNNIAWQALFTGKVGRPDIEDALKAAQLSQNNPGILHTLGCVYAETGKTKEAREVLVQAMDALNLVEPDENYWYAFGRIAEQYGENGTAKSDYERVTKPKMAVDIHGSSYRLAQMRLQAMRVVASSASGGRN